MRGQVGKPIDDILVDEESDDPLVWPTWWRHPRRRQNDGCLPHETKFNFRSLTRALLPPLLEAPNEGF